MVRSVDVTGTIIAPAASSLGGRCCSLSPERRQSGDRSVGDLSPTDLSVRRHAETLLPKLAAAALADIAAGLVPGPDELGVFGFGRVSPSRLGELDAGLQHPRSHIGHFL